MGEGEDDTEQHLTNLLPIINVTCMRICAGLVLMYESGVVMLDLADVTSGWLSDSDAAPQPDARCESLLLILPQAFVTPVQAFVSACSPSRYSQQVSLEPLLGGR